MKHKKIELYEVKELISGNEKVSFSLKSDDVFCFNTSSKEINNVLDSILLQKKSKNVLINGSVLNAKQLKEYRERISYIDCSYEDGGTNNIRDIKFFNESDAYNIYSPFLAQDYYIGTLEYRTLNIISQLVLIDPFSFGYYNGYLTVANDLGDIFKIYTARALLTNPDVIVIRVVNTLSIRNRIEILRKLQKIYHFSIICLFVDDEWKKTEFPNMLRDILLETK